MSKFEAPPFFENSSTSITYKEYNIKLISNKNSIIIKIHDLINIYESTFTIEFLRKNKLLMGNLTIHEMIDFINTLITFKNVKIEKNNNNLTLLLISTFPIYPNVELILNKKDLLSNETLEKIINKINYLKEENKDLKKNIIELKEKIKLIEEKKLNKDNKINELEERIKKLEEYYEQKTELTSFKLKNIKTIQSHHSWINSISCFPSGNIISVSSDKSINIYDINLNILQRIINAHEDSIIYVEIKDDNNFITCSKDKNIKLWIKNINEFKINKIITNAHEDLIYKVIYCSNGNLISCSRDKNVKIWKENNNNYDNIKILSHCDYVCSLLLFEDKNILISSGIDGTKFWNLNNYNNINCIINFEKTWCGWHGGLYKLDEDRIIVNDKVTTSLKVISILKKEIIKEINHSFECYAMNLIKDKGIFLVGGNSKNIIVYRNDNYDCVKIIKNAHDNNIYDFIETKEGAIISSSYKIINIWNF